MASFSFGAGNAAKLLRIPLYILGRVATWVIPRSRDRWVFGSAAGVADGALALWEHASAAGETSVWLTATPREDAAAAGRGIPTVRKDSVRGFWATARARVIVVTHGFGDVNRYATTGAVIVQLWHGIPLKRIGLDSPATAQAPTPLLRAVVRYFYRRTQRRITVIPAASHLVRGRLESAFSLTDEQVPVTGEPRVDVLSVGTPALRRETARAEIESLVGPIGARPLVLYAPTWRDGADDPSVPDATDWRLLGETLAAGDALLLVRSHPLGAGDYSAGVGDRVRMLGSDIVADVTPLLPALDLLVTDYSSLIFDASLVPVATVFLAPDAAAYAVERGFYGRYEDVTEGMQVSSWAEAAMQIGSILSDDETRALRWASLARLDDLVHAHRDGRNTERVYRVIRDKLTGERRW